MHTLRHIAILPFFLLMFAIVSGQESVSRPALDPTNIFGVEQRNQTEVFVASDVSRKVEQAVKDTLAVAVDTWGSSGRFEYWVLGTCLLYTSDAADE